MKKPFYKRGVFLIPAILVVLVFLLRMVVSFWVHPLILNKLEQSVQNATHQTHRVNITDLETGLFVGTIRISGIELYPDTTGGGTDEPNSGHFPYRTIISGADITVNGIHRGALLFGDQLVVDSLHIAIPSLYISRTHRPGKTGEPRASSKTIMRGMHDALQPFFQSLSVKKLSAAINRLTLAEIIGVENTISAEQIDFQLNSLVIDSVAVQQNLKIPVESISLNSRNIILNSNDGFYEWETDSMYFSSKQRRVSLRNLHLIPRYPKYEFARKKGHESDRVLMSIHSVDFEGFRFDAWNRNGQVAGDRLSFRDIQLEVFRDRKMPAAVNRQPRLPHVAFRNSGIPVAIDTVQVINADIQYLEHLNGVDQPGMVSFNNLDASIYRLNNHTTDQTREIIMHVTSEIMDRGFLDLNFTFPLFDDQGYHSIQGTMGSIPVRYLNPVLENMAFVRAENGTVYSLGFSIRLNSEFSSGSCVLKYDGLKINVLDRGTPGRSNTNLWKSFVTNTFVIKKSNMEPPLRSGKIEFERVKDKSVFNFWWKSLLSGIKDTIGI